MKLKLAPSNCEEFLEFMATLPDVGGALEQESEQPCVGKASSRPVHAVSMA